MPQSGISPGLSNASICSQHPEAREVIYKLTANQHLGHFSPSEVLSEPPPMLATVFSRSSYGWMGVLSPQSSHGPIGCCPILKTAFIAHPLWRGLGAAALAALGFGNVLMTCVFSCVEEVVPPGAFLLLSSRGQPPHLIADENAQKFGVEENFFSFSLIRIIFSFNVDEAMPIILVISFC